MIARAADAIVSIGRGGPFFHAAKREVRSDQFAPAFRRPARRAPRGCRRRILFSDRDRRATKVARYGCRALSPSRALRSRRAEAAARTRAKLTDLVPLHSRRRQQDAL